MPLRGRLSTSFRHLTRAAFPQPPSPSGNEKVIELGFEKRKQAVQASSFASFSGRQLCKACFHALPRVIERCRDVVKDEGVQDVGGIKRHLKVVQKTELRQLCCESKDGEAGIKSGLSVVQNESARFRQGLDGVDKGRVRLDQLLRHHHVVVDGFLEDVKIMLLKKSIKSIHWQLRPGNTGSSIVAIGRNGEACESSALQIAAKLGVEEQGIGTTPVDVSHSLFQICPYGCLCGPRSPV